MAKAGRRGFFRGLGGMFEFVNVFNRRNLASSSANANYEALYSYWESVGGYLASAMGEYAWDNNTYANEHEEGLCQQTKNHEKPLPE